MPVEKDVLKKSVLSVLETSELCDLSRRTVRNRLCAAPYNYEVADVEDEKDFIKEIVDEYVARKIAEIEEEEKEQEGHAAQDEEQQEEQGRQEQEEQEAKDEEEQGSAAEPKNDDHIPSQGNKEEKYGKAQEEEREAPTNDLDKEEPLVEQESLVQKEEEKPAEEKEDRLSDDEKEKERGNNSAKAPWLRRVKEEPLDEDSVITPVDRMEYIEAKDTTCIVVPTPSSRSEGLERKDSHVSLEDKIAHKPQSMESTETIASSQALCEGAREAPSIMACQLTAEEIAEAKTIKVTRKRFLDFAEESIEVKIKHGGVEAGSIQLGKEEMADGSCGWRGLGKLKAQCVNQSQDENQKSEKPQLMMLHGHLTVTLLESENWPEG